MLASRKDRCSVGLSNLDDRTARFSNIAFPVFSIATYVTNSFAFEHGPWKILALQICRRVCSARNSDSAAIMIWQACIFAIHII
jgi:hypothetical protein